MIIFKLLLIIILIVLSILYILNINKIKETFQNNNTIDGISYEDNIPRLKLLYGRNGVSIGDTQKYGRCLIIDNEIQLCSKKEYIYHELIVHFPYQYLKGDLKKVIIVGGGDLMTLREIMKYKSIEKVYMLELNKKIVNKCKKYFNVSDFKEDPRVEIIYGDAYKTIDKLQNEVGQIDMCIVDTTEDNTNNLSVDSRSFFYKCLNLLNDKGVLVKNGEYFADLFSNKMSLDCIIFGDYMPYFNSVYQFVVCGKKGNNIQKKHIFKSKWLKEKINTKYYSVNKHNDFILYDVFNFVE